MAGWNILILQAVLMLSVAVLGKSSLEISTEDRSEPLCNNNVQEETIAPLHSPCTFSTSCKRSNKYAECIKRKNGECVCEIPFVTEDRKRSKSKKKKDKRKKKAKSKRKMQKNAERRQKIDEQIARMKAVLAEIKNEKIEKKIFIKEIQSKFGERCRKNSNCIEKDQRCPQWSHQCECIVGYNYDKKLGCKPRNPDECADGWSEFKSSCYKYIDYQDSHSNHVQNCKLLHKDSNLASIHSAEEARFAKGLGTDSYIALRGKGAVPREFKWDDGSPYDFKYWDSGQPNNDDGYAECVIATDPFGKWDDVPCYRYHHATCQYHLPKKSKEEK